VLEAKGLVPETNKPSVEPYVQIAVGKKISLKTKSVKNTLEPKWQERFEMYVLHLFLAYSPCSTAKEDVSEIHLQVLDFTRIVSGDVLGEVRVPLVAGSADKWYPLTKKKGDKQVRELAWLLFDTNCRRSPRASST
jgi:Ca2+-dependent lipid-binding protein